MRRVAVILILIFLLAPFISAQQNNGFAWNPRDEVCTSFSDPETAMGYIIVPTCETEWSVENFIDVPSIGVTTPSQNDCAALFPSVCSGPCQGTKPQTCPICPVCEEKECTTQWIPNIDLGLCEKGLGGKTETTEGTTGGPSPFLMFGIFLIALGFGFGYYKEKKTAEKATRAYKETYQRFMVLKHKYNRVLGMKEPILSPKEIKGDNPK